MKVYEIHLRFVKSFLIEDKDLILVDAGTPGSGKIIIDKLNKMGKNPSKIKFVIFTHSHIDHIGGASEIRKTISEAKFGIDENGVEYLRSGKIREPILHSSVLKFIFSIGKPFLFKRFDGVNVDFVLQEGELIKGIEILKTPGHTNDSISIYLRDIDVIIVGDTLQGTKNGLKYPNIYEDFNELQKSVEKIKSLKPSMVYVSHGISSSKFLV
ncbi:MBL fold metallo-hydrolase [Saccharolobus caldissimus]|uniref:MBL fold metallo-hydrolase n=1 Tax=Saccharolobus caldissimus TaxID=1702097 RepID=A0AAQ4CQF2_9CREN|nr:MBL fold metallo-hydrolase [Saccharolobus caldissimus]BDB98033.1 MBL fold metallo-hydrolase [Saccharolobus caldissimus]